MRGDWFTERGLKALVLLLLVLYEGQAEEKCHIGMFKDHYKKEVNEDKRGRPLYWFDLHKASDGYLPGHNYTLRLHTAAGAPPFTAAFFQIEAVNNCGTGALHVNKTYLFQPHYCPQIIMTDNKTPMKHVPFKWTAPTCGCVTFRSTVTQNDKFDFYEDDKVIDGNLVKTVCQHGNRLAEQLLVDDVVSTSPTTKVSTPNTAKMTRAARLGLLCKINKELKNSQLLKRKEFLERRNLHDSRVVKLVNIELALEQRRADFAACCKQSEESKLSCFENIRRRRIDRMCGDGRPRIPFSIKKSDFMKDRVENCCWRLGMSRYRCFNKTRESLPLQTNDQSIDYSLDESDPANDLADYQTEIEMLEETFSMPKLFKVPAKPKLIEPRLPKKFKDSEKPKLIEPRARTRTNILETASTTTTVVTPVTRKPESPKADWSGPPPLRYITNRSRPKAKSRQGGTGGQRDVFLPMKNKQPVVSASSVEITLNSLNERVWKSTLRLQCCQAGQQFANKSGNLDVWERCKISAREYRGSVIRGKKMCSNTFQKCCVEQFIKMVALQATTKSMILKPHPTSKNNQNQPLIDDSGIDNKHYNPVDDSQEILESSIESRIADDLNSENYDTKEKVDKSDTGTENDDDDDNDEHDNEDNANDDDDTNDDNDDIDDDDDDDNDDGDDDDDKKKKKRHINVTRPDSNIKTPKYDSPNEKLPGSSKSKKTRRMSKTSSRHSPNRKRKQRKNRNLKRRRKHRKV